MARVRTVGMDAGESLRPAPRGPLWQACLRWHYAAGLLLFPFFAMLAVTGVIYLFKPQVEPRLYRSAWVVPVGAKRRAPSVLLAAAQAAEPGARLIAYRDPDAPDHAAQFTLRRKDGVKRRVWVDPYSTKVTGAVDEDGMLMQWAHDLHGKLLLGKPGAVLMDLVAGWGLVLVLCGLVVWWPRRWLEGGALRLRLGAQGRTFWRDLHAVPAALGFVAVFVFLLTGLPWTEVTGAALQALGRATGSGAPPSGFAPSPFKVEAPAGAQLASLDAVTAVARERLPGLQPWIYAPKKPGLAWVIHYKAPKPQDRAYIHVDPYSAAVLADYRWKDHGLIGKFTAMSVSLHEGTWFGGWNQLLNSLTAALVLWLAATGFWLWWRRRPAGSFWALPPAPEGWRWPLWLRFLVVLAGLAMPAFGASLLLLWVLRPART